MIDLGDPGDGLPDSLLVLGPALVLAGTLALLLGAAPTAGYAALGRALSRHPGWLVATWWASLALLTVYLAVAIYLVVDLTSCAAAAENCPALFAAVTR